MTSTEPTTFFGATAWTFRWDPPYEEPLRRIAMAGCHGCELIAWSKSILENYYTPSTIAELRAVIDGEGMVLTNFFFGLPFRFVEGAPVSRPDTDAFRRAVEVAFELGADLITSTTPYPFGRPLQPLMQRPTSQVWTAPVEPYWDWKGERENVVETFVEATGLAAEAGLRVAIEPHPYRWVTSAQSFLKFADDVGADNLGLNYDPSHLFPGGDMPHIAVYQVAEKIFHTHMSDNDGTTNAHWRPGKGKIDWAAVLRALKDVGYEGPISLELEDVPGASHKANPIDSGPEKDLEIQLSIKYLSAIGNEAGMHIATREVE